MNDVEWTDTARDQLADIWVAAASAERIRFEANIVLFERLLAEDPLAIGESREGSSRVAVVLPLVYWFSVESNAVRIYRVHRCAK